MRHSRAFRPAVGDHLEERCVLSQVRLFPFHATSTALSVNVDQGPFSFANRYHTRLMYSNTMNTSGNTSATVVTHTAPAIVPTTATQLVVSPTTPVAPSTAVDNGPFSFGNRYHTPLMYSNRL